MLPGRISFNAAVFATLVQHDVPFQDMPTQSELRAAETCCRWTEHFYVGATQNPARRWCGDEAEDMPGHSKKWLTMLVLTARVGKAGPKLEACLIEHFLCLHPGKCRNVAIDARGLSGRPEAINFIYICFGLRLDARG
eukprot:4564822-Pyramimonas_sp.AAC.1